MVVCSCIGLYARRLFLRIKLRPTTGFTTHELVELLQLYCNELPFEFMHDLFKWKFISRHSMLNASNRCFMYFVTKHCDGMKLCKKILQIVCNVLFIVIVFLKLFHRLLLYVCPSVIFHILAVLPSW